MNFHNRAAGQKDVLLLTDSPHETQMVAEAFKALNSNAQANPPPTKTYDFRIETGTLSGSLSRHTTKYYDVILIGLEEENGRYKMSPKPSLEKLLLALDCGSKTPVLVLTPNDTVIVSGSGPNYSTLLTPVSEIMSIVETIAMAHDVRVSQVPRPDSHLLLFNNQLITSIEAAYGDKDGKTGLLRDVAFYEQLATEFKRTASDFIYDGQQRRKNAQLGLALYYIDFDRFKQINDTYGHLAADKALTFVAEKLKKELRSPISIGRMGGDEFAVMFSGAGVNQTGTSRRLVSILQEITSANVDGIDPSNGPLKISLSIGCASYPDSLIVKNQDELLHMADRAMYSAKKSRASSNIVEGGFGLYGYIKNDPNAVNLLLQQK